MCSPFHQADGAFRRPHRGRRLTALRGTRRLSQLSNDCLLHCWLQANGPRSAAAPWQSENSQRFLSTAEKRVSRLTACRATATRGLGHPNQRHPGCLVWALGPSNLSPFADSPSDAALCLEAISKVRSAGTEGRGPCWRGFRAKQQCLKQQLLSVEVSIAKAADRQG